VITKRIEEAEWLDGIAERVRNATKGLYDRAGSRSFLSGTPIGHSAHPAAVAGSIGFFSSAVVLDWTTTRGRRWASRRLIELGILGAGPAVITGWSDWMDTAGAERRVGLVHALANSFGLGCMVFSLAERAFGRSGRLPALSGMAAFSVAGWLGGHLAYSLGVGTDANAFETGPSEWTPMSKSPDRDHPLIRADIDGVRLVAVDREDSTYVLADRCSHRGGPLSEGELTIDGCIRCPWHGSEFVVSTGAVRHGPAAIAQPSYEVRGTGSTREVRRREPRALRNNSVRTH
jgi:nitrite reductase/ring-hydroxylating ferredoxin subunit/uncharacterized membrane protein